MTVYEARAVSYPGIPACEIDLQPLQRERSDSLPEPRHFRRLRRELDLDSDLDKQSRDENAFLRSEEAKQWKSKRVTHKQLERTQKGLEEGGVVISTEPMGSPTPVRDIASSPTALTHIPWTNWTRWNYKHTLEITGENLEDLLAYDDLFLDYFNAFLALPVFPQVLRYNRLTGAFEEVILDGSSRPSSKYDGNSSLPYGVTDGERDAMLQWARKERLPLFLSTQLFREFKLCKLLLRPLDDRYSASRGSTHNIRGYSRQSESYVSSLSNSADNSANDVDDEDFNFEGHFNASQLFKYQRPGSRALSVPAPICYGYDPYYDDEQRGSTTTHTHDTSKTASVKYKSKRERDENVPDPNDPQYVSAVDVPNYPRESTVTFDPDTAEPESKSLRSHSRRSSRMSRSKRAPQSDAEAAFLRHARALSAPINYDDYMRHPYRDFDMMFGEDEPEPDGNVYVTFEDEGTSEAQTETDVKNLEGRLKMTFQQLKEHILGSYFAMENFKEFLSGTAGKELVNFWLDCEFFKDVMEKYDEVAIMDTRNRLFRDIQDKFKIHLTKDAIEQISKAASNSNLSHSIFIRTQYDVLRRLRAYWVIRYMLHMEREQKISQSLSLTDSNRWITGDTSLKDTYSFFPSINLVSSMPVRPDDVLTYTRTKNWESVSKGGRRLDDRVTSAKFRSQPVTAASLRTTKERFLVALAADKMAGGPFERFLACHPDHSLVSNLLFWQDVTEYGAAEDRAADRMLRMCNAWAIFNRYISDDSEFNIEISVDERNTIHKALMSASDFVDSSVFNSAKQHSCDKLEEAWIRYLKEDLKIFLDCHIRPGGPSPPGTAAIEIILTNDEVLIRRPRPWQKKMGTTESERARRAKPGLSLEDMDEEELAALRAKRREARKEMERERRKAVKAAYKRLRDSKRKPEDKKEGSSTEESPVQTEDKKDADDMDFDDGEKKSARPPPPFHEMIGNKAIMSNFKKHLVEQEEKECLNMVGLFTDIETFLSYGTNKKEMQRREQHANFIQKTYLDSHGKKKVELSDKLKSKIHDKERPKTPVIKEIQHSLHAKIDEQFKSYLVNKAEEQGIEPGDLVKLSQAELSMRLGTDASMGTWRKTRGKGKDGDMEREYSHPSVRITISKLDKKSRRVHFEKEGTEVSMYSESGTNYTYLSTSQDESSSSTPRGPGSSQMYRRPKRARFNTKTGRAQPHKDDREEFYKSLKTCASGKMSLQMLYFYKYLLKHSEEDNMPLIDKDLFFYIEVQKFKECSHQFSDEELLRRKVQSLMDCFLESFTTPALQIDIGGELQQKTLRSAQRYLAGKEVFSNIFDEAQLSVFKELLPYWAGFRKTYSPPDDPNKKPVTKYQKMLKKRMENIDNYVIPPNEFQLPSIPEGAIAAFTFSLSDGVKLRYLERDGLSDDGYQELTQGEENNLAYVMDSSTRSSKADLHPGKHRTSIGTSNNPTGTSSTSSKKESSSLSAKS
ncbi:uncharacterized protein LOC123527871 isoform X6 [Mercenaria mercenaria]|uniref:uncharacterized protein LOC123527871 isoform X6 n=1 Tax=Mercenaria mercenaria TaxID=6596 RepID=UPI00234F7F7D|nr:uncharacterized protein LOC123527871 isoform X6 [Mercenaria mercenaria]